MTIEYFLVKYLKLSRGESNNVIIYSSQDGSLKSIESYVHPIKVIPRLIIFYCKQNPFQL